MVCTLVSKTLESFVMGEIFMFQQLRHSACADQEGGGGGGEQVVPIPWKITSGYRFSLMQLENQLLLE